MIEKLQLDEPAEGVARLTISNPERRGALDHDILDALAQHARTLDARCVVIRGSGDVFSAGYDIGNLSEQEFEERGWWRIPSTTPLRRSRATATP